MASVLSTSTIDSLITSYENNEYNKIIEPLNTTVDKYTKLSSVYTDFTTKLDALKSTLANLKLTNTDSLFSVNSTTSSNTSFVSATASNLASLGTYDIRVDQIAKSDIAISQDLTSATANAITGTHSFQIKTGDGSGGEFLSNVDVTFTSSETNQTVIQKIADAVNADQAVVSSNQKTAASSYSGGATSFVLDLNGTQTTISATGGGTYEQLVDELVANINTNVSGVTAKKILDSPSPGDVKLQLTVNDKSNYISITHSTGFDIVTDLGIGVTKEKGAGGIVTASSFSPTTTTSQLSLTSKDTGVDYRIKDLSDSSGSTALNSIGLNLGTTRTAFNQTTNPDTSGFLYSDITTANSQLNSKFTFNNLSIQRNSNTISDLVNGVTFNLNSVMQPTDSTVNLSVSRDSTSIRSTIEDFITKFNDIFTYLKNNSQTSTTGNRGALIYDGNATSIISSLTSAGFSKISGLPNGAIDSLSQIGITFDPLAGLSITDSTLLDSKIDQSPSEVEALFNSSNGIANTLFDRINPFLGSGGYLATTQSTYDQNVTNFNDRITSAKDRIIKSSDLLRKSYQEIQLQLANLESSQSLFNTVVPSNGGLF